MSLLSSFFPVVVRAEAHADRGRPLFRRAPARTAELSSSRATRRVSLLSSPFSFALKAHPLPPPSLLDISSSTSITRSITRLSPSRSAYPYLDYLPLFFLARIFDDLSRPRARPLSSFLPQGSELALPAAGLFHRDEAESCPISPCELFLSRGKDVGQTRTEREAGRGGRREVRRVSPRPTMRAKLLSGCQGLRYLPCGYHRENLLRMNEPPPPSNYWFDLNLAFARTASHQRKSRGTSSSSSPPQTLPQTSFSSPTLQSHHVQIYFAR